MAKPGNIFLVGPMGAGKTTVGRRLAEARGMDFVDSDQEVEARTANSTFVHLWNEMWRREGFDKDDKYDPACLYQQLRARYVRPAVRTRANAVGRSITPEVSPSRDVTAARLPAQAFGTQPSSLPRVSAVVLSKNGAGRISSDAVPSSVVPFAAVIIPPWATCARASCPASASEAASAPARSRAAGGSRRRRGT